MNDFVNPQHRGVDLPPGFKDLVDVLNANDLAGAETPIYALNSKRPSSRLERHVRGLSHVETYLNLLLNSQTQRPYLSLILKGGRFFYLRCSEKVLKVYVSFEPGDSILEKTLREIFAEVGVLPILQSYSPLKGPGVYCFQVPIGGTGLLELMTKVLRASGVSDTDALTFLFRA